MLKGKTVLLGVTGGIAAYKSVYLASLLKKLHASVEVIMTKNAQQFITPLTFEQITGNRTITDTFDRNFEHKVEHISLAERADIVIIAPATANVCAKLAYGIADDMLTTTVLACRCKKVVCPAMNTGMYENPVTQDNLEILRKYGFDVVEPAYGELACGTTGAGRLPEPEYLKEVVLKHIAFPHDLEGKRVLVSAGPTREAIDPVRFITNHSSGKMGYAIAENAMLRGATVTLVTGPTDISVPDFVNVINIESAAEMFDAVTQYAKDADFIFKAAAVADYTPAEYSDNKVKKKDTEMSISLTRTKDILKYLGENRRCGQVICGFSMETENMLENSRLKLEKKNVDMICANNLKQAGAGFGVDTNIITLITKNDVTELGLMTKNEAAKAIIDKAILLK
ncbi:MAG: bifunctional phosphopantothenoylcysteine decarboxylase/phosphopantothenate--cysteine ligase CoaBC [Clostridia bacterium]|nr:bifunctional phosphopantothenoylcysteine decarboxylase/phosphopantothenate--cysteine ligase CoaBC [Clostridia bacterium]